MERARIVINLFKLKFQVVVLQLTALLKESFTMPSFHFQENAYSEVASERLSSVTSLSSRRKNSDDRRQSFAATLCLKLTVFEELGVSELFLNIITGVFSGTLISTDSTAFRWSF